MERYSREEILNIVEEEDVEFIRLQFTDMFGTMKNIAIPAGKLPKAMDDRCIIDASSIEGFIRTEEAEMYLRPDLSTFSILPWRPQQGKVARLICDLIRTDGTPYEGSPRYLLKEVLKKAESLGYTLKVNTECEFFLFHTDDNGIPTTITHERAGYLDLSPVDLGENARRDIVLTLEEMGYEVESSRHQIAPGQHEVEFSMDDALETADKIMTVKTAIRTIAKRHGLHATFMPKPKAGVDGSGMHIHLSLFKNGKNVFYDPDSEDGLSSDAYAFLAGILKHIKGMTAFCNPLVNSYKRLTTGFEAPSQIYWSKSERASLVKVPFQRGQETRLELRSPDGAANPYVVFALCLAAGLEGIENHLKPQKEGKTEETELLPSNLSEALKAMKEDGLPEEVLGKRFLKIYNQAKEKEWMSYMEQISMWELEQYLYKI